MFLPARACAISSSFRRFFLFLFSLYNVSCIPFMEVVTVLVSLVMFFHGSYGLSKLISSLSNCTCVLSQTGIREAGNHDTPHSLTGEPLYIQINKSALKHLLKPRIRIIYNEKKDYIQCSLMITLGRSPGMYHWS